jgi:IS30 family transposase
MHDFENILKNLPEKPMRSRLEPYGKLIKELLRHRRTYREIARILSENCQTRVSISTIHDFVRLRLRAKRDLPKSRSVPTKAKIGTTSRIDEKEPLSVEREPTLADDLHQRIAALKQRPASIQGTAKQFHYDPDEPLHLPQKTVPKSHGE